ncbi:EAL domain-containing protein [uncultured Dysosmobacter sp.]|uniref:bifunctional diguanylate cyclase/phosphodiesterase n=1 Tax=uncultured Dysosmobacter sp. TaxID=2591384 RepID=UPI00262DF94B|nr:EAL domain-containing protein [uncultured Dysosmobacter sp.]
MLVFYSVIVLEVIFLMAILAIMANTNELLPQHKRRLFLLLFLSVILAIIAEWSGTVTVHFGGRFRQVHIWTKVLELSLTPVAPLLCAEILNCSADLSKKARWIWHALILHAGVEILSAFSGFIFYVDSSGLFRHGPFYWIYLATYLCGAALVLWTGYQVSRQYQNRNRIILVLLLLFLLFGVAANQIDKSIKSAWLTVAIDVALIYVFYNDMIQRIDKMTMLLNRTSYNNQLSRLREPAVIQLFDVDLFKSVNEQHGRLYGDHCLQVIGSIIRNTYGNYGKCYRIEGDKFCVILETAGALVDTLNEQFLSAMGKHRKTDPNFPYISLGYAQYEPFRESLEDAVQTADAALYRNKERNKIKYGPIPHTMLREEPLPSGQVLTEGQESASAALDTSGLTDRTFTAFSGTSERSYIYLCNMNTGVSRWSPAAVQYFGLPGEYMFNAGKIWESHIHPQDREMYHEDITAVFSGHRQVHALEYRAKNRLGEYVVCTCRGVVLKGDGMAPDLFAGTIINHGIVDDVDPITNLHNNAEFTKSIYRLVEEQTDVCVIKLGIEHFRHINAMYGQQGGNQVLRLFGMELQELVGGKGRVFRLEGAKFALYLYGADQDEAQEFFRQLQTLAENNIQINNLQIPLRIYGGAVLLDSFHSYNASIVRSSLIYAMEQSLENYRNQLVFSKDIRKGINTKNVQLHTDIHRSAIEGCRSFFLCYQPIVSFSTGKIIGAEALLRWKQEPYGVVPPDSFIPWLENDPVFIQVGNWILRQAIEETKPMREADPDFILNVNISDTQLEHSGFREDVLNILDDTGCPPRNLCLELTERCRRLDLAFLADELKFFRSHGIIVALDDFGTGTSSLTLLLQLPIDEVKVDRVFLSNIFTDQKYRYMMECITRGSRMAGFRTCVEGIETREQHDLIASLAGDCYQGYYASRPIPIGEFLDFYRENMGT